MNISRASCRLENNPYVSGPLRVFDPLPVDQHVAVLVHGYNNSSESAHATYESICDHLTICGLPYDAFVGLDWPGSKRKIGFPFAVPRADIAGFELVDLIKTLQERGNAVSLISHSLGARVVLRALSRSKAIKHVLLLAPAVDADSLSSDLATFAKAGGEFYMAPANAEKIVVMHSSGDRVLQFAYWISEVLDFKRGLKWGTAMGRFGPSGVIPPNVEVRSCDPPLIRSHSGYIDCGDVYMIYKGAL